jgi:hypothetical protein
VTEREILQKLEQPDVQPGASVDQYVGYHGQGHFHVWEATLEGRVGTWILKSPTHEDEQRMLFRELALARIGRLFEPPITPHSVLAVVPETTTAGLTCRAHTQDEPQCDRPVAGPIVFATQRLGRAYKSALQDLDPESLARVVAYCAWVGATDSEYVDGHDGRAYSIDHADSLCGAADWREGADPGVLLGDLVRLDDGRLRHRRLYSRFLDEVRELSAAAVVEEFTGIPHDWLGLPEYRAHEAAYLVARMDGVEEAIAKYVREPKVVTDPQGRR